jgi:hypothetical protein
LARAVPPSTSLPSPFRRGTRIQQSADISDIAPIPLFIRTKRMKQV